MVDAASHGIQSGPSPGPLYASGLYFDTGDNVLYMTGIHYNTELSTTDDDQQQAMLAGTGDAAASSSSSCFIASVRFDTGGNTFDGGIEDYRSRMNNITTNLEQETCTALTVRKPSELIVMGTKETSNRRNIPSEGMISVVDKNNLKELLTETNLVGKDNPAKELVYPVTVTTDAGNNEYVYFASLTSIDAIDNTAASAGSSTYPDWLKHQRYGSSFDFHVTKVKISETGGDNDEEGFDGIATGSSTIISKEWTTEFPLDPSTETPPPRVYIGGILHKKISDDDDYILIVVGSTRGIGPGYGLSIGDDEDGFVTVIDPMTGEFLGDGVREGSPDDDIVTGICDDPNDPDHFFIVGATEGEIGTQQANDDITSTLAQSLQPFVRQVKTDRQSSDDDNLWTMQWMVMPPDDAATRAFGSALGCAVDGDYVYVAGTVDGGASIVQGSTIRDSQGGDDVFITKIDKTTQKVLWMTQVGSDGHDRLARYDGLTLDTNGNPLLYGDTTGSLYRTRSVEEEKDVEDMFVMSLDATTGKVYNNDLTFVGGISSDNDDDNDEDYYYYMDDDDALLDEDDENDDDDADTDIVDGNDGLVDDDDEDEDYYYSLDEEFGEQQSTEYFYSPIGLQISGPAYAGSCVYDPIDNNILLAGATYNDANSGLTSTSLCFLGVVNMDDGNLISNSPRGSANLQEACSAITFDTRLNAAYAVGVAETDANGQFANGNAGGSTWVQGQADTESGGLILQLNKNIQLLGGSRIVDYPATYPVSVLTHPLDNDYVFVASMASKSSDENDEFTSSTTASNFPNFLERDNRKYGSEFFLMINRYRVNNVPDRAAPAILPEDEVPSTLDRTWFNDFRVDSGEIWGGGMIMAGNGNVLVVAGSTRGGGGPFEQNDGDGDMDGFILKVNPEDGELVTVENGSKSSTRLDSINSKDDWILNACNDRFDHDAFYVVGKSMGKIRDIPDDQQPADGSVHAYVAKVDLKTLNALWLKHFTMTKAGGGIVEGEALACTVTPDTNGRNIVYVGGTIKDGSTVDEQSESFGNDDIFVASMDGGIGDMNWIKQMGTVENDRLAAGQGLDVDSFGNVIVYAETGGSFYDKHKGDSDTPDLVVLTVNKKDGSYLTPMSQGAGVGSDTPPVNDAVDDDTPPDDIAEDDNNNNNNNIVALQTGYDRPLYAGGMYYDSFTNSMYVTGASYVGSETSHCFFGIVNLPRLNWIQEEIYGTEKAPEACSAISLANYMGKSETIIVGSSEKSGLMDDFQTARRVKQYGMILDLANIGGNYEFIGGAVVDDERIQYPIEVVTDNDKVFVLSMASRNDKVAPEFDYAPPKFPNFTKGGVVKYGGKYEILVERHTINRPDDVLPGSMASTMSLDWRKPLKTADNKSMLVSGMAIIDVGKALIVVGSTPSSSGVGDLDGMMAKVTTDSGSFALEGSEARSVAYFSSITGKDDWILNVCTDPDDDNSFYIVGATGGKMDPSVKKSDDDATVHAVVSKIRTDTLSILWTTQFAVLHSSGSTKKEAASVALGCAVIPGQGRIYVAGDVENGAILEGSIESAGGDDIFVSMLETDNGKKIWTKQHGSNGDDRIARGGGIACDANGNAVVYGDTTGDFHRIMDRKSSEKHKSDVFIMVFNQQNGSHEPSLSNQSSKPKDESDESISSPSEWFGPTGLDGDNNPAIYKDSNSLAYLISFFVICLIIITCYFLRFRVRKRFESDKKNSIFTYLQQFTVEDIDLRKSPPGGWHGTYMNQLAQGINTASQIPEISYTDAGVNDTDILFQSAQKVASKRNGSGCSLIMNASSTPVLGGGEYQDNDGIYKKDNEDDTLTTRYEDKNPSYTIV